MLKKIIIVALIALLAWGGYWAWIIYSVMYAPDFEVLIDRMYWKTVPVVHAAQLNEWLSSESVTIVDAREPKEYEVSQLSKAIRVGFKNPDWSKIDSINPNNKVVVYCTLGYRAERIGEKLLEKGFKEVYNLYGGITDWSNQGFPVYDGQQPTDRVHCYSSTWSKWLTKGEKVYE